MRSQCFPLSAFTVHCLQLPLHTVIHPVNTCFRMDFRIHMDFWFVISVFMHPLLLLVQRYVMRVFTNMVMALRYFAQCNHGNVV